MSKIYNRCKIDVNSIFYVEVYSIGIKVYYIEGFIVKMKNFLKNF